MRTFQQNDTSFHIIESGYFQGDGGVMFGPVPKKYWSAKYKVDEKICVSCRYAAFSL